MFPQTDEVKKESSSDISTHVETVVLLRREKVDGYVDVDLDVESLAGKGGTATYEEIKTYVEEKYGLKVSSGLCNY